jgi:hypothetical protein
MRIEANNPSQQGTKMKMNMGVTAALNFLLFAGMEIAMTTAF